MAEDPPSRCWPWLRVLRVVLIAPFLLLISCWLILYGDSVYQRRKAEKLLKDLKSFQFATADFADVRKFVLSHGGRPDQAELAFRAREEFGFHGGPPCTPQNCTFQIVGGDGILWRALEYDWLRRLAVDFDGFGIRPWRINLRLEVSRGKLKSTDVEVASGVSASWRDWRDIFAYEYEVNIAAEQQYLGEGRNFAVGMRHVTGPPQQLMAATVLASAQSEAEQALDINLLCTTRVLRGCAGLRELAPPAWAKQASVAPEWEGLALGPVINPAWLFVTVGVFVGAFAVVTVLEKKRASGN